MIPTTKLTETPKEVVDICQELEEVTLLINSQFEAPGTYGWCTTKMQV